MAKPCCLTCIHCTVSQASFTSVPQASFIQVSLKLHSQVSLKIHSQIKCPSSQHCSDDIFSDHLWTLFRWYIFLQSSVLQANIVQMIYFSELRFCIWLTLSCRTKHFISGCLVLTCRFFSNWNTGYLSFLILYWEFHSDFIHWFTYCFQSILLSVSTWIIKIDEDLVGIGIVIRNLRYLRNQVAQKNYQNPTGWIIKSCKTEVNLFPDLINWQAN
jgi:hypothetical protein